MSQELLQRPTLVLNRNWQPVHVTSVARALSMVWAGTARVVDVVQFQLFDWEDWAAMAPAAQEEAIRTSRSRIRLPEVIALQLYDRMPRLSVSFSRRNLLRRDRNTCQYCGQSLNARELTVDHVKPRSRGGESSWENCVLACRSCNRRKADRTPQQAGMRLRREPVRPIWRPDFSAGRVVESWAAFLPKTEERKATG